MMNNCFICSRESYDFERHGGVSKPFYIREREREERERERRERGTDVSIELGTGIYLFTRKKFF